MISTFLQPHVAPILWRPLLACTVVALCTGCLTSSPRFSEKRDLVMLSRVSASDAPISASIIVEKDGTIRTRDTYWRVAFHGRLSPTHLKQVRDEVEKLTKFVPRTSPVHGPALYIKWGDGSSSQGPDRVHPSFCPVFRDLFSIATMLSPIWRQNVETSFEGGFDAGA